MKIGLLSYHSACNMGATLQLLSTYCYLQKCGEEPIIINWVAEDLERMYEKWAPLQERKMHQDLRSQIWKETPLCRTEEQVAKVIQEQGISAVIIGSDAVAQHRPFLERLQLSRKTILTLSKVTSDRLFPNPFWGTFNRYLEPAVPVAVLSASSQDSMYRLFSQSTKKQMSDAILKYKYISVRDDWTRQMIAYITNGKVVPQVTPDPVFAFNTNASHLVPTFAQIQKKYDLPDKYFVLSFLNDKSVSQQWLEEFETLAGIQGIACVSLPFAHRDSFGKLNKQVPMPLSPIDWFAIIKYSAGYIGNNMHPVVVSLHNGVPLFSFDNYGLRSLNNLISSDKSSKIRHILSLAGLLDYRISILKKDHSIAPADVLDKLLSFPIDKETSFAKERENAYMETMQKILTLIKQQ